jgi:hypothetical protein
MDSRDKSHKNKYKEITCKVNLFHTSVLVFDTSTLHKTRQAKLAWWTSSSRKKAMK